MMKYLKIFENTEPEKDIEYYDNGNIQSIEYKINGKYHRKDGPAYQKWYENGQKSEEYYFINDLYHREDGPALMIWYENGKIDHEAYYIKGYTYKKEEWINKLKQINSPHYKEQKMLYEIDKYNL